MTTNTTGEITSAPGWGPDHWALLSACGRMFETAVKIKDYQTGKEYDRLTNAHVPVVRSWRRAQELGELNLTCITEVMRIIWRIQGWDDAANPSASVARHGKLRRGDEDLPQGGAPDPERGEADWLPPQAD